MPSTAVTAATAATTRTFYKLDIQGIVYLVDPATSIAYTYEPDAPTEIGRVLWTNPDEKPRIALVPDWQQKMTALRAAITTPHDATTAATTSG